MDRMGKSRVPVPGLRNIKTALAVFLCLLLYSFIGRTGIVLATVAIVICMQDSVEKSVESSINRIIGTAAGGAFAAVYLSAMRLSPHLYVSLVLIPIGIVILIYLLNLIKLNSSIVIACVVYLIIILDSGGKEPIFYALNRIVDTTFGILIALLVNRFFFRPKPERVQKLQENGEIMKVPYYYSKKSEQHTAKWSGGTTTELLIYPAGSSYADRNFLWRISSATVNAQESDFTKLPGYSRHLMVLDGKTKLIHEGHHTVTLEPFEQDLFEGDWNTKSIGKCTDFNLMLAKTAKGELLAVQGGVRQKLVVSENGQALMRTFYILEDGFFLLENSGEMVMRKEVTKGDFLVFDHLEMLEEELDYFLEGAEGVVAVSAGVFSTK